MHLRLFYAIKIYLLTYLLTYSVLLSVTIRHSVKTAKRVVEVLSPHINTTILVFNGLNRQFEILTESPEWT